MSTTTYLFAGGGTGGHIYPALAIAERLTELDPGNQIKFIVSQRPLDGKILQDEATNGRRIDCIRIDAKPFGLGPKTLWSFARGWGRSVSKSTEFLELCQQQGKVNVIAMGGFVAAPVVEAAIDLKIPVFLVNLDAVPGKSNRWTAKRSKRVFTTYDVPARSGWEKVGPIVRKRAMAPAPPEICRQKLGLPPHGRTLFITGASQGARTINEAVVIYVQKHAEALRNGGWQIIHQTGEGDEKMVRFGYVQADLPTVVASYTKEIGTYWGAADVAIARAGAGTVSEARANRVPTLFLPYPHHKDQHQKRNAQGLVDLGAARLAEDANDSAQNALMLAKELETLLDPATISKMRSAFVSLGPCDGAATIAKALQSGK
jgi:UDP-N-acetylglucosamine--N-acetylmuramyl-(pentapeptide) pyrophosphoryl-undecaprenol N-acetylglucosamine transferase